MSEQDLAAHGAAEESAVLAETQEGQEAIQPAEVETPEEEAARSESQKRRERRKAAEAEMRTKAAEAVKRAEEAEAKLARIAKAAGIVPEPKESDFTDTFEYVAAKAAWRQGQQSAQIQAAEIKEDQQQARAALSAITEEQRQARVQSIADELPAARARFADLDSALAVASRADIVSPELADLVLDSEDPLGLTYHLGKNPDLARALSAMPERERARQIGRLEASLTAPQPKIKSDAPPPITPVRGGGVAQKNPENMTVAEWAAARASGWSPS